MHFTVLGDHVASKYRVVDVGKELPPDLKLHRILHFWLFCSFCHKTLCFVHRYAIYSCHHSNISGEKSECVLYDCTQSAGSGWSQKAFAHVGYTTHQLA